jgi:type VI secretion system protein ImpA
MASPAVLDFDRLLAPIAGDSPGGPNLRLDPSPATDYQQVKMAREAARAAERRGFSDVEGMVPGRDEWRSIMNLAPEILATQAKDLQVASWMIEAIVREQRFAGLRDGLILVRRLVEEFWDHLHPMPDEEDGIIPRIAPLTGLNGEDAEGTLIMPIYNVPITAAPNQEPFTCAQHRFATEMPNITDAEQKQQRAQKNAALLAQIQSAAASSSNAFFRDVRDDVAACLTEFESLGRVLNQKCGKDATGYPLAPPTSNIKEALENCRSIVALLTKDRVLDEPPPVEGELITVDGEGGGNGVDLRRAAGAIRSREEAFLILNHVAQYFERNEPQSVIPHALRQVERWGRASLLELMMELIPDDSAREHLFSRIGVKPPPEG